MSALRDVTHAPSIRRVLDLLSQGRRVCVVSRQAGFFGLLFAAVAESTRRRVVAVSADEMAAEHLASDIACFAPGRRIDIFPSAGPSAGLDGVSETTAERVRILAGLADDSGPSVLVTYPQALCQPVPAPDEVRARCLTLAVGSSVRRDELIDALLRDGYEEKEVVELPAEFARRGGILDIYPPSEQFPVRVELSGPRVVSLRRFEPSSQLSFEHIQSLAILPLSEQHICLSPRASLADYIKESPVFLCGTACRPANPRPERADDADWRKTMEDLLAAAHRCAASFPEEQDEDAVRVLCTTVPVSQRFCLAGESVWDPYPGERLIIFSANPSQESRMKEVMAEKNIPADAVEFFAGVLSEGFAFPEQSISFLSNDELFRRYRSRHAPQRKVETVPIAGLDDLRTGDFVVHYNEGIGRFLGLAMLDSGAGPEENIVLEYAGDSRLYVPVSQVSLIHKYVGRSVPQLSELGSKAWVRVRERVKGAIRDMAADLYRLYLSRRKERGFAFLPDTDWEKEFEHSFLYRETPDQAKAIAEVKTDMVSDRIMDRLVCGDSGYGKTEVAMRAAFKAVMSGRQVLVLVPTTVLALQHALTFKDRFADFPVRIEMLCRCVPPDRQATVLSGLADGTVDIVIGTHRLLQDDVRVKNLGLLIIDEEQRFGVAHKEKMKIRFRTVDVLTLTATPIPRTLYLSLSGLRDISLIETPPLGRLSVVTYVGGYDPALVRDAIVAEMERGGQVFYLHNFIHDIEQVRRRLQHLMPHARIGVAHGRMNPDALASVMREFSDRKLDVLVATTIVENGLDIPRANTLLVDNAHRFGLADLYQLRGRVGRYKWRAYAFFLIPPGMPMTEKAKQRLSVLRELNKPGSGFQIAMKDLEIRGAGNILGREQHGFIDQVGFHLYCQFWKEVMSEMRGERVLLAPHRAVPARAAIPPDYVSQPGLRLWLYRSIAGISSQADADRLAAEIADRFGPLPDEVSRLISERVRR